MIGVQNRLTKGRGGNRKEDAPGGYRWYLPNVQPAFSSERGIVKCNRQVFWLTPWIGLPISNETVALLDPRSRSLQQRGLLRIYTGFPFKQRNQLSLHLNATKVGEFLSLAYTSILCYPDFGPKIQLSVNLMSG